MLDAELLKSVASQLLTGTTVTVAGISAPVRRASRQHLKTAAFSVGGHESQAIEQNPEKPRSLGTAGAQRSSGCAIQGRRTQQFVAVVVDGEITFYGASKKQS